MKEKKSATKKTHILWNPDKNYLGNWDIPRDKDLILTIQKIQWEEVKNPVNGEKKTKRVVHFVEKDYKPLICNEENANAIHSACNTEYLEDFAGKNFKIALYTIHGKWFGEEREAVRVRSEAPKEAKKKPVLTRGHEKWETIKKKAFDEGLTADYFADWFEIPADIAEEINNIQNS